MRSYSSAAALLQPEPEPDQSQRAIPLARTTIFQGVQAPKELVPFQAERMPLPVQKNDAVARQIVEYVVRLQLQNQAEALRSQTEAITSQAEAINKIVAAASVAKATEIAAAAQAKAKDSMLKAIQHLQAEEKRIKEMAAAQQEQQSIDAISRTTVVRGASIIVGAMTLLCWLGTALSGTVFVHPLLSIMLMIGSVIFYMMSKVEK